MSIEGNSIYTEWLQERQSDLSDPIVRVESQPGATCWECIGSFNNPRGGKIYEFRLKEAYSSGVKTSPQAVAFHRKNLELFPAIEPSATAFARAIQPCPQLRQLGYRIQVFRRTAVISLPDKEALETNFGRLLGYNKGLRSLRVISSEGIASDFDFVRAFFSGTDMLISTGQEFVHDHFAHAIPTLRMMLSNPVHYYQEKERLGGVIKEMYDRISTVESAVEKQRKEGRTPLISPQEFDQVKTVLGAFVDDLWASSSLEKIQDYASYFFYKPPYTICQLLDSENYRRFWARKYPGQPVDEKSLQALWSKIIKFQVQPETLLDKIQNIVLFFL